MKTKIFLSIDMGNFLNKTSYKTIFFFLIKCIVFKLHNSHLLFNDFFALKVIALCDISQVCKSVIEFPI